MDTFRNIVCCFSLFLLIGKSFARPCMLDVSGVSGVRTRNFTGSRVEFTRLSNPIKAKSGFSLEFKTKEKTGLILFAGEALNGYSNNIENIDFVAVYLHKGHLRYLLKCGNGNTFDTHGGRIVSDGEWHKLEFQRTLGTGYIRVRLNGKRIFRDYFLGRCETFPRVYLGGIPEYLHLDSSDYMFKGMRRSLDGCIRHFRIDDKPVDTEPVYTAVSTCK